MNDILRPVLSEASDELLVVEPSTETVEGLFAVTTEFDGDLPEIRVVADESVLKEVMDDFIVASNAADLIEEGRLSLRTLADGTGNSLFITEQTIFTLVTTDEQVAALTSDDDEFVEHVFQTYRDIWAEAPEFNLRTPAISRIRETLRTDIGEETEHDFNSVLASLETARGDGDGLDEVTISLLVAARNEVLLYDISKWGEDVGLASKATFSRVKTKLEDMGLIDTEKVPVDVGRPRLRLKLDDERLRDADVNHLASVAQSLLN